MNSDDKNKTTSAFVTRRKVIRGIGMALAVAPLGKLLACTSSDPADPGTTDPGDTDSGTDGGVTDGGGTGGTSWATGGTVSMQGNYPDPFASGISTTCTLTCAATLGPCYANTLVRQDISEGHDGLPVRLAFLVVDESCTPVPNASIDIWHAAPEGLYSGDDASDFCTSGDATARAARWFRGVQTTDASGRADFDTCFPGWYSSRTVHIHFTIRVNDQEYVTSQLFFDDALDDEIINGQPLYNTRGPRDTTNANDNVISADTVGEYLFQTQRMDDGAMLAWKTLVIRSSLSDALCDVPGGGGGGGPPPGFDGGMPPPPRGDGGMGPPPGFDGGQG
jgi:protocatechuate 3,4-dioxygenase beta subunit